MNLVWFRNDLRLTDNPALYYSCRSGDTLAVAMLTPDQWRDHNDAGAKVGLWLDRLRILSNELSQKNIALKVIKLDTFDDVAKALEQLFDQYQVTDLWFNYEYPLNERQRDQAVVQLCEQQSVELHGYHADVVLPPGSVKTKNDEIYKVFTPFSRTWRDQVHTHDLAVLPAPDKQSTTNGGDSDDIQTRINGWSLTYRDDLWPCDTQSIHERLDTFAHNKVGEYKAQRDYPGVNGTSGLSPYLSIGAIGVRECFKALNAYNENGLHTVWGTELIWREFYRHLLASFDGLSRSENFKATPEPIKWQSDEDNFTAWCEGKTGYPIVDAAMKQLNQTGWMHNRLRMVTASFLTKLLMIDWRLGEAYFMTNLIDGDYASNNGGWQWAASTGADSVPYFRIFSPLSQSEKFDKDGAFIKKFLPELDKLDKKSIHNPSSSQRKDCGYPESIVDYKFARERAKDRFAYAMKGT